MRRTPTQLACLGFIHEQPASGYDILKAVRDGSLKPFLSAGQAAIYDGLRTLEKQGALVANTVVQSEKPSKIIYSISTQGKNLFQEIARHLVNQDPDFRTTLLLVRFQKNLPSSLLQQAFSNQIRLLKQQWSANYDPDPSDEFLVAFKNGATEVTKAQIKWIAEMQDALQ